MSNVDAMINVISSIGFPIFVCLILFYYISKEQETLRKTLVDLITTLNNNTNAMNNLLEEVKEQQLRLEGLKGDDDGLQ